MNEIIGCALITIGVLFNLGGCIGLIRMPDIYNRLQAATKCVTLGTCSILFGVFVYAGFSALGVKALLCIVFILITSPTAAHALAKGAYKDGVKLWKGSVADFYGSESILTARDIMNKEIVTVKCDTGVSDAMKLLVEMKISGMPVVDTDGNIVGIVSEKDIIDFFAGGKNITKAKVRDIMTSEVVSFSPETDINKIAKAITENKFRRVPIVESGKPVGIISRRDILQILASTKDKNEVS